MSIYKCVLLLISFLLLIAAVNGDAARCGALAPGCDERVAPAPATAPGTGARFSAWISTEEYLPGFTNSTHMIIAGAVHSDPLFLSSPKIKEGMMEFLRGQPVTIKKITAPPIKFTL